MAQGLEFDPTSEDAANVPLAIWDGTSGVRTVAHTYPTPALEVLWASSIDTEGELPAGRRYQNRKISLTVECTSAAALRTLQAKVAKIGRAGGTLKWTLPTNEVHVFDLLAFEGYEPKFDITYHTNGGAFCSVDIGLVAKPFSRGAPVTLSAHTETTLPVLTFTETNIKGDVPATGTLLVEDLSGHDQKTVIWGVESERYSAAADAVLFYYAKNTGLTGNTALSNDPSGGQASTPGTNSVVKDANLLTGVTWLDEFNIFGTHTGTFRVLARVYVPGINTGTVSVRLRWILRNNPAIINTPVAIPPAYEDTWRIVDLGLVSATPPPKGVQSLRLTPQAQSTVANDDIYYDWITLIPVAEGSGEARASATGASVAIPFSGRVEISSNSAISQPSSTSSPWGAPNTYEGDRLTIPQSGLEGKTVRFIVKGSGSVIIRPGDAANVAGPDTFTDDIRATLTYVPRYLVVPTS